MQKETETDMMHDERFGERHCFPNKARYSLAKRIVPALNMGCLTRVFATCFMLIFWNNSGIGRPKVAITRPTTIDLGNCAP